MSSMVYRRFGRTELAMPVLSCGGMRYQHSWNDVAAGEIPAANQDNLERTILRALELGINHIETARGYGSSERQLGRILPGLPREKMIIQTKIGPQVTEREMLETFDTSLERLGLDYVDLLAIHGLNDEQMLGRTLKKNGSLAAVRRLRDEGRARHIGFSTHGPLDVILGAIETGEFDYVNLHWYYFDQINAPAIEAAREQDMGVFIISPSDKGGKLYDPSAKLVDLCRPLSPMAFNDLFCLARPDVHTLSIGAARPADFDAHMAAMPFVNDPSTVLEPILARLDHEMEQAVGRHWMDNWTVGLPRMENVPGEVHLYHVLRLHSLAKAYDMTAYGKMRYNMFGSGGHWFPGNKIDKLDWAKLPDLLRESPVAADIPAKLREAHDLLNDEPRKRLSES